jgi:hypothetical protein
LGIDIGKSLKVAVIPIVILIAIGVFSAVVGSIPVINLLTCITGIPLLLVSWAVLAWSGYKSVKEAQMDIVGGLITGLLAGGISGLVSSIVYFVMGILGIGASVALGSGDGATAALGVGIGIFGIAWGIGMGILQGAVLGAIGAFVAGMHK